MSSSVSACAAIVMLPSMSARLWALKPCSCALRLFKLLPGETRNVLLAQQGRAVTLDAVELLGKCRSSGVVGGSVLCAGGAAFSAEK